MVAMPILTYAENNQSHATYLTTVDGGKSLYVKNPTNMILLKSPKGENLVDIHKLKNVPDFVKKILTSNNPCERPVAKEDKHGQIQYEVQSIICSIQHKNLGSAKPYPRKKIYSGINTN